MPEPYRVVSALPSGTAFSRLVMTLACARGDLMRAQMLAERFKDTPQVGAVLAQWTRKDDWHSKAAVAAGTTTDATFAGPLAVYGVAQEALAIERGMSIVAQLAPKMRRVPFRTAVARETGSTGGAWVGEGFSTPVAATAYDTLSQEAYKAQTIVVLTTDLLKLSSPNAERAVRETVMAGVAALHRQSISDQYGDVVREPATRGDHERRDGGHGHRIVGGANSRGPQRDVGVDHDGGRRPHVDHASADGVQNRRDDWRDRGCGYSAHAVRHSFDPLAERPAANHTGRCELHSL